METINTQASPSAATEQATSPAPQRKGGFVQGAVVAQGCCGEPGSSGGCCGTPAQDAISDTSIQAVAQGGCCGAPAAATQPTATRSGCCG